MAPAALKVAVIGAGVAGLCAARELKREGHDVVLYEKANQIGGTWVYNPEIESDPIGLNPDRKIIHSSLYRSLCTNLPKQLMGFSDYPFRFNQENGDDYQNFTGHERVLEFLNNFAADFGIVELVKFNNEVVRVEKMGSSSGKDNDDYWVVESRRDEEEERFDAVVICNGHYTIPRVAQLPGTLSLFPSNIPHNSTGQITRSCVVFV